MPSTASSDAAVEWSSSTRAEPRPAKRYEHLPVRAGTDAWFLLGVLNVLVVEDLVDHEYLAEVTTGFPGFADLVCPHTPERCGPRCEMEPDTIRDLARAIAAAASAVLYGRHGACTQQFGTLNNLLLDCIAIVTGNFGVEGGLLRPWGSSTSTGSPKPVAWAPTARSTAGPPANPT